MKVKVKMKFFFLDDARQRLPPFREPEVTRCGATRDTSADLVLPSKQIARRFFE